jgi:hypothetical protein
LYKAASSTGEHVLMGSNQNAPSLFSTTRPETVYFVSRDPYFLSSVASIDIEECGLVVDYSSAVQLLDGSVSTRSGTVMLSCTA